MAVLTRMTAAQAFTKLVLVSSVVPKVPFWECRSPAVLLTFRYLKKTHLSFFIFSLSIPKPKPLSIITKLISDTLLFKVMSILPLKSALINLFS